MYDAGPNPDIRSLDAEAYGQSGYFSAAQARAHRVSRQLLDHHIRQGRFVRVRRGLYRVSGFPSSEHDDIREKWMAVGVERAVVSHESALAVLDLSDNIPDRVHLLVPRRHRGLRRPAGVVIHTHSDGDLIPTVWRSGLPVTTPARTIVDVLEEIQPEQAAMAVGQGLSGGLLTLRQLWDEAKRQRKERLVGPLLEVEAGR
jgi:predicted transcriptional regulator of viral defense system